jgi:hypothetical protein
VSPAWGLGVGLTIHRKIIICYEMSQRTSDFDGFFGQTNLVKVKLSLCLTI